MLARLVAFDTTSRDGNIPLIEFVEAYLDGWGVKSLRVDYEAGKKTNLYATIGPDIAGGIVLSGHTDVVPVDGQNWSSDPFAMVETSGASSCPGQSTAPSNQSRRPVNSPEESRRTNSRTSCSGSG